MKSTATRREVMTAAAAVPVAAISSTATAVTFAPLPNVADQRIIDPVFEALNKFHAAEEEYINAHELWAEFPRRVEIPTAPSRPAQYAISAEGIDKAIAEEEFWMIFEGANWEEKREHFDEASEYRRNLPDPRSLKIELRRIQAISDRAYKAGRIAELEEAENLAWHALLNTRAKTLEGVIAKLREGSERAEVFDHLSESALTDLEHMTIGAA